MNNLLPEVKEPVKEPEKEPEEEKPKYFNYDR